jgi:hypothetical protein
MEAQIAELEGEKEQLGQAVNEAGGDYERLGELAVELKAVETELDEVMERWLVLSEKAG